MANVAALILASLFFGGLHASLVKESDRGLQEVCLEEGCQQQPGQALLQVRRSSSRSTIENVRAFTPGLGSAAPLTADGFNSVRALCCSGEMLEFVRRLIQANGKDVCHGGGLAGTILYYDCTDDSPDNDFTKLLTVLDGPAADPNAECPWIGYPTRPGGCPPMQSTCGSFPDATFPPCGDDGDFICCGEDNGYVPTHANYDSKSAVAPWNCKAESGPIQVLADDATGKFYNVSVLDLATDTYKLLWQIPLTITTPAMKKRMNSAAYNPVDGRAYATIYIDAHYIIRFDRTKVEFVAKMPALGTFSQVFEKDNLFIGGFSQSGTYLFGGNSGVKGGVDMFALANIAAYEGQLIQDASLPTLTLNTPGFSYTRFQHGGADIGIVSGHFDKQGESEWMFMMNGDCKLGIAKIPKGDDISSLTPIILTTSPYPAGADPKGFGAAWVYSNELYISRNNGDGVFHVLTDSIDILTKTYKMKKVVEKTPVTNNNDGLNCMDAVPPFPGVCKAPEFEIDKVDGKCPKGSKPVTKP